MQNNTNHRKKIAPIIITVLVVLYMVFLVLFVLMAAGILTVFGQAPLAVPVLLIYAFVGLAVIIGIVLALRQRLHEIDGGEEDEASKY